MRCLNPICRQDGLSPSVDVCPKCNVILSWLMRDLLQPGTLLYDGKYRINEPLGRGGFGVTYLAKDERLGRSVAIKEFFPREVVQRAPAGNKIITPSTQTEAFQHGIKHLMREGRILAELDHPNVVRILDYFEENGTAYLVMEMINGQSLRDELEDAGRAGLPESRVRELIEQLVLALEVIHERKIYHLDLKPENVMIRARDHCAKLIDFGAARQIGLPHTTKQPHTPAYAPWEVVAGDLRDDIGDHSDLFAFGMMLHELLTGELPPPFMDRLRTDWQPVKLSANWGAAVIEAVRLFPEERPRKVRDWWETFVISKKIESRQADKPPKALSPISNPIRLREFDYETVWLDEKGEIISRQTLCAKFHEELLGGVMLEMVKIPAGEYLMGSPNLKPAAKEKTGSGQLKNEFPQHPVKVKEFFIGKHAITQQQWQAVAGFPKITIELPDAPFSFEGHSLPAERVSWDQAKEFCARLSKHTGREYRLPTEAEWEYACRAGTTTPFAFGERITTELANFGKSFQHGRKTKRGSLTVEVNEQAVANGFGLFDMHGNVQEWCEDVWHDSYDGAPDDGSAWLTGGDSSHRVLRGGSWYDKEENCRAAFRNRIAPDCAFDDVGFRVAFSPARIEESLTI
jgi:formylglycine-generating enzyme required for sulfatase activity